jgi:hypothetical protein
MKKRWMAVLAAEEDVIHIVPGNDLMKHYCRKDCWCKPTCNEDGTWVHHAADMREEEENGLGTSSELSI